MSGVLIIGASRSGTSMTAGLFAVHGVFFGDCVGPHQMNPKGFFENKWLKKVYNGEIKTSNFDAEWKKQLTKEGWNNEIWGAKCGAERWSQYWHNVDDIKAIVCCYRPRKQIEASRAAVGFNPNRKTIDYNWGIMKDLREQGLPVVDVWTNQVVEGDYLDVKEAFSKLGLNFDTKLADEWIEPEHWRHG